MSNPSDDSELARLATRLLQGAPYASDTLMLAERLIADGRGGALFDALVRTFSGRPDPVPTIMTILESMMHASPRLAAYLMARLYPVAGRASRHEVYRAIELWMDCLAASDVAEALKSLAAENVRPALKLRYAEWARAIEQRATPSTR